MNTEEDVSRLPSGGMPDTDPLASSGMRAALPQPDDPEAMRVRAVVTARMLGEESGPSRIGRFTVLERVAEGGMGVVFAAYDGELDRKVAIKVIRRDLADASVQRRIVREAQAMAKLSHPNVAQVFEVGEHQGSTFIAMEFVRGTTLRAWQPKRSWREIVAMYVQAAHGLAAAHAEGLVHRDFKPDNAIVGKDGRVRVLDFGLARAEVVEDTQDNAYTTLLPAPEIDALGTPLTKTGSLMGTPAYMAPEQLLGEGVDAKADQFAFCVALWEALFGERPFGGSTRADLAANVTRGRIREPPKDAKVPAWVRAVIVRGLAVGPSDRFASMDALVLALEDDPTRRRRRRVAAIASISALALGVGGYALDRQARVRDCVDQAAAIAGSWGEDQRRDVDAAILATAVGYAASTAARVTERLDTYATNWSSTREATCRAEHVDGTMAAPAAAAATDCLRERRDQLDAAVEQLVRVDHSSVELAILLTARLPRLDVCTDEAALERRASALPSAEIRERVSELRRAIAGIGALAAAKRHDEAHTRAAELVDEAERIGWAPLHAEALYHMGQSAVAADRPQEGEQALEKAVHVALAAGHDELMLQAAGQLIHLSGHRLARYERATWWAAIASMYATRLGLEEDVLAANVATNLGTIHHDMGAEHEARAELERGLAIQERVLGPEHPDIAVTLGNLAVVHRRLGAHDVALEMSTRVIAIEEAMHGADHPRVARALTNLGIVHFERADWDAALAAYERALHIQERALGRESPRIAPVLNNIANVYVMRGELAKALAMHERALELRERSLGPEHPDVAMSLENIGIVHFERGDADAALPFHERALAIRERVFGPDHPAVGNSLLNLGNAHELRGDDERSLAAAVRALRILSAKLEPDHPDVAVARNNLGWAFVWLGRADEARAPFEQALAALDQRFADGHPITARVLVGLAAVDVAQGQHERARARAERAIALFADERPSASAHARFVLARALWDAAADRPRALELAETAARDLRAVRPRSHRTLADIEAWLAKHGAKGSR